MAGTTTPKGFIPARSGAVADLIGDAEGISMDGAGPGTVAGGVRPS
jgi:hypothetical protein